MTDAMPTTRLIRVDAPAEGHEGVALVTIDRPEALNALSFALLAELADALETLDADGRTRAAIITGATSGNSLIEDATAVVRERVHQGVPIAVPIEAEKIFPPMVSQMVRVGEETGELEKMLGKIADFYEDEVDSSIATLTSILEPLMMIGVGMMVGVIIISMYLPMFKLLTLIQ